jgi:two-component system, chemotaxis family, chemotaxis protein CheY
MDARPINCVWVIDDDPLQVLLMNRLLTAAQLVRTIKFFSGAKAAIDTLNECKGKPDELPNLIFLDLIMSKGDGWEFLEHYKKSKGKSSFSCNIIVISFQQEDECQKIHEYPDVFGFLPKPVNKKQFDEIMSSVLAGGDDKNPSY